jgi:hypothetical protein
MILICDIAYYHTLKALKTDIVTIIFGIENLKMMIQSYFVNVYGYGSICVYTYVYIDR